MPDPEVSELLYDGETVEREVTFGSNRVVVTSHRLLAVTPDAPGANFRKIDRPNVEDVGIGTDSSPGHLVNAGGLVVLAVPLVAASRILSFDGMFEGLSTSRGAQAIGVSTGFLDTLGFVFGLIDDALLWSGVVCLVLALPFVGLYVYSRTTVVRIDVAGGENVSFPVGNVPDVDESVAEVRHALGVGPPPESASDAGASSEEELEYGT
jgi:hypothetical protein